MYSFVTEEPSADDEDSPSETLNLCLSLKDLIKPVSSPNAMRQSRCLMAVLTMLLVTRHDHHSNGDNEIDVGTEDICSESS